MSAQDLEDGLGAGGEAFVAQALLDPGDGELPFAAQGDDAGVAALAVGAGAGGFGPGGVGEEEGAPGGALELGEEIAEGTGGVVELGGGLGGGEAVDKVSAEGFVLAVDGVGGREEAIGEGMHEDSAFLHLISTIPDGMRAGARLGAGNRAKWAENEDLQGEIDRKLAANRQEFLGNSYEYREFSNCSDDRKG